MMIKLVIFLALAAPLLAESPMVFTDEDRLTKLQAIFPEIDAVYKEFAEENQVPGYVYGIILDGTLVHSGSGGFTDLDKKIPVTTHSMFRIASMTKSFVAMAILKLRDAGKLRLDDPISLYLPEMKMHLVTEDAPKITIRDLLTHASGLPYDDPWSDRQLATTEDEFKTLLMDGLTFSTPSGTTYDYSSTGYALLGEIVKRVSGTTYEKYIADTIWQPIKMTEATWNFADVPPAQLAHGYRWTSEGWQEEELLPPGAFGAMGGMLSSLESFIPYMALHQYAWPPRDEIELGPLNRSSIREMHQAYRLVNLDPHFENLDGRTSIHTYAYGYGLRFVRDSEGRVFVGHTGGLPGFGSNWFIMPEYGLGVVFFANTTYVTGMKINLGVLDKLIVQGELSARQLQPSKILRDKQSALLQLLPAWEGAATSHIFAENFFLDQSIDSRKEESAEIFAKAGKIISVHPLVAKTELKGSFILECESANVRVDFSLTPEREPLIQQCKMTFVDP